jgi:endonuclease-3
MIKSPKVVNKILDLLQECYPDAKCELHFGSPFQLLVATILSAQSTDKTVNKVTDRLFLKYPDLESFLGLSQEELEQEIRKSASITIKQKTFLPCAETGCQFSGEVPKTLEALTSLPGVGRKTANVVLSNAFGIPALAVDTHVFRVANRIGLSAADTPEKTEEQLNKAVPKKRWSAAHHLLIWHGRRCCGARKPECDTCRILPYCDYRQKKIK